ncbi:MAG: DUF4266 domain-containing protein [Planctomycetota bacterium]
MGRSRARRIAAALLAGVTLLGAGCRQVDYTEKRELSSPLMQLDDDPTEAHFRRKATDSREASAGARDGGGSAGGGCGCY